VTAIDLEKVGKGSLKEIVSVVRTFAKFQPFTIQLEDGTRRSFDSLLFANIAEMAKYATLSETGPPNDRRFEVITLPHSAKWRVLGVAFRAATRGLGPQPTVERYAFTTLLPIPLQLDGELLALDPGTPMRIDIAPDALADQHLIGQAERRQRRSERGRGG
jgi:diacylglycerol kinase (ATP)